MIISLLFWNIILLLTWCVSSHTRLVTPVPQSTDSGIKTGPCGTDTDNFFGSSTSLTPGFYNITFEETVLHSGDPLRIALSLQNSDGGYDGSILLDHIPLHDKSTPQTMTVTVDIPDVLCDKCKIQLISIMVSKTSTSSGCCIYSTPGNTYEPNGLGCFSNYHSCAIVAINGTQDRGQTTLHQPDNWPWRDWTNNVYHKDETSSAWVTIGANQLYLDTSLVSPVGKDQCANLISDGPEPNFWTDTFPWIAIGVGCVGMSILYYRHRNKKTPLNANNALSDSMENPLNNLNDAGMDDETDDAVFGSVLDSKNFAEFSSQS